MAALVAATYRVEVLRRTGKYPAVRIPTGSRLEEAAVLFMNVSRRRYLPVADVMEKAFGFFTTEWCMKVFRRPYPPINVVLGEKCRARLEKEFRPLKRQTRHQASDRARKILADLKKDFDRDEISRMLDGGWPTDPELRRSIQGLLR